MVTGSVSTTVLLPNASRILGRQDSCVPTISLYSNLIAKPRLNGFSGAEVRLPPRCRLACLAGKKSDSMTVPTAEKENAENDAVPVPKVVIDQDSDPNATVVELTFGDRLGALLDTMESLRDLGLNVVKANVNLDSSGKHNTFYITVASTGRKVEDPELLESIRLSIINNLIKYHPESSIQLAMGAAFGITPPMEKVDVDIATHIRIYDDGPNCSLLCIETADRPGLLVEIVKMLADINVSVESGEFDTEGLLAKAKFHVRYRGAALIKPMKEVVSNSLRYYLRRPTTEESSF